MELSIQNRTGRRLGLVSLQRRRNVSVFIVDSYDIVTVRDVDRCIVEDDIRGDGSRSQFNHSANRDGTRTFPQRTGIFSPPARGEGCQVIK